MKVIDKFEEQFYAVKKVRLHLPLCDDLMQELKKHRVYREAKAVFNMKTSDDLKHTVRYYNSWFEDLTPEEIQEEEV